jgi:hypothetical protein
MKRKLSTETLVCPQERLVIISYTIGLSFALEGIGTLAAITIIVFYLLVLYLLALLIASVVMMKMTDQLGTQRGRYDEHSSKFPSVRNQGFIVQQKVNTPEGDAC